MKSGGFTVDNIDLEDEELNEAIVNYNVTLPRHQGRLKVAIWSIVRITHLADSAAGTETTIWHISTYQTHNWYIEVLILHLLRHDMIS